MQPPPSNRRSVTDSSKESGCLCRATPGGRDNRYRRAASVHHGISRAFLLWGNVFRQHEQRVRDFLHVRGQRPCGNGTELCCNGKELQSEIDNIETTHSGYDEYRYDLDTIGHNPHELASYLTALLQSYTPQSAQAELNRCSAYSTP